MKQLRVPFINVDSATVDRGKLHLNAISMLLDLQERHAIGHAPWPSSPEKPEVTFAIAHARNALLLKYYVTETYLRAANFNYNSPVFEDSCVECFISFNQESYYNLEMNTIGTLLMGYGNGRHNRQMLQEAVLKKISRQVVITRESDTDLVGWELTVVLPVSVFAFTPGIQLSGRRCRANFYKCGDRLPDPHFLCWSPITADAPDFHLPAFFGELCFE